MSKHNFNWENPSLEQAQKSALENELKSLRTAFPARVIDFDATTQSAVIECLIHTVLSDNEGGLPLPPLENVPVIFPRTTRFAITFPIHKGDEGIAIIADRCIDAWWVTGKASKPLVYRMHDLSDAIFIPGINSLPTATQNFDADALAIRSAENNQYIKLFQSGEIEIDATKLTIKCPTIFENLLTYQNGIAGSAGNNSNALSGDFTITEGDLMVEGISLKRHIHIDSEGGNTSEAK
ncbi:Gp138 family membrane-puncturing spike protein [Thorsellia anophelis]|uniref:Phage protein Gp138 N-terminal domain-containing protein n=1 Tax=Thorsellia anophelis DSM 18579 TaxID=1123402 RepID=A0A1I0CED9_9GAMM|nr:Gp138 family membrane-puncturing spike protein [Thorsellia anophelis]SET17415.1 hypothetical protein SAMN02583745_01589 [Thorsellia anophelis DSM 18579]